MRKRKEPYSTVGLIVALAAFVGAGVGAGSALAFAGRRVEGVETDVDDLERRVRSLEGLEPRVNRLESGEGRPAR